MKKTIVACIVGLFVAIWFGMTLVNAQTQTITVTRQLTSAYSLQNNSWGYGWHITVKCGGRPPKEFVITEEQYADLYFDAVHDAQDNKGAVPTVSAKTRKTQGTQSEVLTISTTYQGKCVEP